MKILFTYASRSRPENFRRGVNSIINNATGDYEIVAIVDDDDVRLPEYDFTGCHVLYGKSESKIHAINRICNYIPMSDCDIIVNMSDDMVFTREGFDVIIRDSFCIWSEPLPYTVLMGVNLDQLLLFHDGNRHDLVTMSIMGRKYYERDKYIYNPDYKSLWCDNEATEVAERRGCLKKCYERIFDHLHPAYGKAVFDKQYQETESYSNEDYQTYLRRKGANFGL